MEDYLQIEHARKAMNISRETLAEKLKISVPSYGRLARGERKLTADERDLAFAFLGIDKGQESALETLPIRRVPLIGKIAAGNWKEAIHDAQGWFWCNAGGENTFALIVEGDSMNLIIEDGGYVAIDPDDKSLVSGRIYAVMNGDGETTIKKFRADPARLEPASTNPDHHVINIGADPFKIIGRVVWKAAEI
tara:strand:- start:76013 stop:76588 length:576 start_codon:yes stop_codon:yes gene_type:complete